MSSTIALPCDCAGTCTIMGIFEFEKYGDDESEWYVDFFIRPPVKANWRWRISQAWRELRGREFYHSIIFYEPTMKKLRDWLNESKEINN